MTTKSIFTLQSFKTNFLTESHRNRSVKNPSHNAFHNPPPLLSSSPLPPHLPPHLPLPLLIPLPLLLKNVPSTKRTASIIHSTPLYSVFSVQCPEQQIQDGGQFILPHTPYTGPSPHWGVRGGKRLKGCGVGGFFVWERKGKGWERGEGEKKVDVT